MFTFDVPFKIYIIAFFLLILFLFVLWMKFISIKNKEYDNITPNAWLSCRTAYTKPDLVHKTFNFPPNFN